MLKLHSFAAHPHSPSTAKHVSSSHSEVAHPPSHAQGLLRQLGALPLLFMALFLSLFLVACAQHAPRSAQKFSPVHSSVDGEAVRPAVARRLSARMQESDSRDLGDGADQEPLGDPQLAEQGAAAQGRYLIYRGALSLFVTDVAATQEQARRLVVEYGGYLQELDNNSLTLRIPNARFLSAMESFASLGELRERRIEGQDVSEQMVDLRARLRNAEAVHARLTALLAQAESVEDTLAVERELSRLGEQIELLQGRLRALTQATSLAVLRLHLQAMGPSPATATGLPESLAWVARLGAEQAIVRPRLHERSRLTLPEGFVRYHEERDLICAVSAQGLRLRIARHQVGDHASSEWWMQLISRQLQQRRNLRLDPPRPLAEGLVLQSSTEGQEDPAYLLALVSRSRWQRNEVLVFEVWGEAAALEQALPAIEESLENLLR